MSRRQRPRLCFVGWGDHVHVERWAGYFARAGYEVSVVSLSGPGRYPKGVTQYCVGLQGRGRRWVELKLRYLLWRIRPDIVHVHWAHFAAPVRNAWRGPLVVTVWGSDVYRRENFSDRQWRELAQAVCAADLVTCDSDDLAEAVASRLGVSSAKVEVIQWGVDTDAFAPEGPNLRAALGLSDREVVFSVRNFTPLYNQETVVEAYSRLRNRHPRAFLLMKSYGGDPDYISSVRAEIQSRKLGDDCHIVDTIPYEQMPDLYRTADVTISIPFSDATPMSVLEAMAAGSTPVCSDLPSLREWIRHGESGFLADPTNVESVTAALGEAFAQPDGGMALHRAAREIVLARASQKVHMDRVASHYRMLVAR